MCKNIIENCVSEKLWNVEDRIKIRAYIIRIVITIDKASFVCVRWASAIIIELHINHALYNLI